MAQVQETISVKVPVSVKGVKPWLENLAKQRGMTRSQLAWECIVKQLGTPNNNQADQKTA